MKEQKKSMWTYLHFISSIVLKISDKNRRLLQITRNVCYSRAHPTNKIKSPFRHFNFANINVALFGNYPLPQLLVMGLEAEEMLPCQLLPDHVPQAQPHPRPGGLSPVVDGVVAGELALRLAFHWSGYLTSRLSSSSSSTTSMTTLMCLIPPLPSSTVTSVGLSQKSSSFISRSESNTSSDVDASASLWLLFSVFHFLHQPGIFLQIIRWKKNLKFAAAQNITENKIWQFFTWTKSHLIGVTLDVHLSHNFFSFEGNF